MPQLCSAPRYARTVECNGRRLLVSRLAHVLPVPRVSEDPLRKTSSSDAIWRDPRTRDGCSRRRAATAADRFRNRGTEPRRCFTIIFSPRPFPRRDLHRSRIARSIANSHPFVRLEAGEDPLAPLRSIVESSDEQGSYYTFSSFMRPTF